MDDKTDTRLDTRINTRMVARIGSRVDTAVDVSLDRKKYERAMVGGWEMSILHGKGDPVEGVEAPVSSFLHPLMAYIC